MSLSYHCHQENMELSWAVRYSVHAHCRQKQQAEYVPDLRACMCLHCHRYWCSLLKGDERKYHQNINTFQKHKENIKDLSTNNEPVKYHQHIINESINKNQPNMNTSMFCQHWYPQEHHHLD